MGCKRCKKRKDKKKTKKLEKCKLVPFLEEENTISSVNPIPDSIWVMGCPNFWNQSNQGEGVKIAVIDTGIDDSHPLLAGKVIKRRDYVKDNSVKTNFNSHGTHVAGTICADGSNLKGVAPKAQLYDYRVLDKTGAGSYVNITQAIIDATNDGCHIINMSLGGPTDYTPLHNAIKNAVSRGVLVVCAAGNEGANKISYPGYYKEVVSVGAVQYDSITGNITTPQTPWFSNTNSEVDLCADGWRVYSTIPNNKYAIFSGTSMATPHVVGYAALIINKLKKKLKRFPSESELYTVLRSNTYDILPFNNTNLTGSGFVTVYNELPKKNNSGKWYLPTLELYQP